MKIVVKAKKPINHKNSIPVAKVVLGQTVSVNQSSVNQSSVNQSSVEEFASAVEQRAYLLWQRNLCQHGRDLEHWFRAEKELLASNLTS